MTPRAIVVLVHMDVWKMLSYSEFSVVDRDGAHIRIRVTRPAHGSPTYAAVGETGALLADVVDALPDGTFRVNRNVYFRAGGSAKLDEGSARRGDNVV